MAEAVVDGPMTRFFCHKCSVEIERLLPDYKCPRCASGFIEELESNNIDQSAAMNISHLPEILDVEGDNPFTGELLPLDENSTLSSSLRAFNSVLSNRYNGPAGSRSRNLHIRPQHANRPYNSNRAREEMVPVSVETFIQDFILNLSEGAAQAYAHLPVLFLGNPGDYVWGQDGLDAIVTQLLNQMDGTGPPPLPKKQIDEIPTVTVGEFHVDSKLQCSVCWEDFKLSEPVKQLPCLHLYHEPCIVPWLELHGTCPICRQHLGDQSTPEMHQDNVGRRLVALFRAANESNNTRSSSSSSRSNSSSSSNVGTVDMEFAANLRQEDHICFSSKFCTQCIHIVDWVYYYCVSCIHIGIKLYCFTLITNKFSIQLMLEREIPKNV